MTATTSAAVPADVDVIVVGGGVAGAVAALRARTEGARVLLVGRAGGGTAASSGALDVADPFVGVTPAPGGGRDGLDALARGGSIEDAIHAVAARQPRHPYARLAHDRGLVAEALAFVVRAVPSLALASRADGCNHVLATAAGTVKRAALVPASQLLDLADLSADAIVGVVGWDDLAGYDAGDIVAMLEHVSSLSARPVRAVPVVVPRLFAHRPPWERPTAWARFLDEADHRAEALGALRACLQSCLVTPTHLLTPAVLSHAPLSESAVTAIDALVGCPLRELLALPPSVPGERWAHALRAACVAAGVVIVDGGVGDPVVATDAGGDPRRVVALHCGGRRVATRAVVLAGGRFFGGGLVRDQRAREALFGLPVFIDDQELDERFVGDLVGDTVDAPHALFRAGLLVDESLRPLDRARRVAFTNVIAAGAIVGGWDPARDGTALGVSAWLGFLAGRRAVEVGL